MAAAAGAGGAPAEGELGPVRCPPPDDEDEDLAAPAPLTRGEGLLQRAVSSLRTLVSAGTTRTPSNVSKRSADSASTSRATVFEGSTGNLVAHQENEPCRSDEAETMVQPNGIRPGMGHTIFESRCPFRLQVQANSVQHGQSSGPIKVNRLQGRMKFEDGELEGVLEVECHPSPRRFDHPLLFDFLVDSDNKDDPVMDDYGRIRYEILTRDCRSNAWVRDPEGSTPLKIVKDDMGRIYVRAEIWHFSIWGLGKKINIYPEEFMQQTLPWVQRKRHRSVITNETPHNVRIYVYVMRSSQWTTSVDSLHAGIGVGEVQARLDFSGDIHEDINPAAKFPQMAPIKSKGSHWVDIPREGAGIRSSRKAVVAIFTSFKDGNDVTKIRLEALVHLPSKTSLTVTLDVDEEGKVRSSPVAEESGGILSLLMSLMQNQANATLPSSTPTAGGRSRSEANTNMSVTSSEQDGSNANEQDGSNAGRSSAGLLTGPPAMANSKNEENSCCADAMCKPSADVAGSGNNA